MKTYVLDFILIINVILVNSNLIYQVLLIVENGLITGALDNTITNSVMLLVIENLFSSNSLGDIEFLFSEGEEVGLIGISKYLKNNKKRLKDSFFINLDVTNEGFSDYHSSIEYEACNFICLKEIQKVEKSSNNKFFYTYSRVGDDTDAILSLGFHGFSYCLPTNKGIHSYRNCATLESLEPYFNGLIKLLKLSDLKILKKRNIRLLKIVLLMTFIII